MIDNSRSFQLDRFFASKALKIQEHLMMNHGLLLTWANKDVYPPKEFIGREIVSDI